MQILQRSVWYYLISGGDERKTALKDLVESGFFNTDHNRSVAAAKEELREYLDKNPRYFCNAGIERFRSKFLLDDSMHIFNYSKKQSGESSVAYHAICGHSSETAGNFVHTAQVVRDGTKTLCEGCRGVLSAQVAL